MPTYVYKFVETGETIEVQQSFKDDSLTEYSHPDSGDIMAVKKVFQPVGVTFKGSGFFKNDNRGKQSSTVPAGPSTESSGGSNSEGSSSSESSSSSSDAASSSSSASSTTTSSESSSAKTPSTTTSTS